MRTMGKSTSRNNVKMNNVPSEPLANQRKSFLLSYLEDKKADLSLDIQRATKSRMYKIKGTSSHNQQEHHSTLTAPYESHAQCCL